MLAAVAVWAVAVPLSGTHLLIRFGSGAAQSIGIDYVIGASLAASLAGWGLLALLERRTARARRILDRHRPCVVVVLSLRLPLTAGTTLSSKVALALMHVAVAAVLIPALRRSSVPFTE